MSMFDLVSPNTSSIQQILRDNGSRITPQRESILEVFFQYQDDHLSAEDIFKILKKDTRLSISLATVYRTINTLMELGILREIDLGQEHKHYELAHEEDSHYHIICTNCDHHKTIEFHSAEIDNLANKIAQQYNVEVSNIELKIIGLCKDAI